ncbi:MAG: hypothetical protein GY822_13765 [Deltaproteobacteria bacterium]|nr:hypothetical protein [Deltaproteobacteria bacterium]
MTHFASAFLSRFSVFVASSFLVAFASFATFSAHAAPLGTQLQMRPNDATEPYEVRYSQGVMVSAKLTDDEGNPISGKLVTFHLSQEGGGAIATLAEFQFADAFTAADGVATARLVIAKGMHGQADFAAARASVDLPGLPYQIVARYIPTFLPDACQSDGGIVDVDAGIIGDGGVIADEYCASETAYELFVAVENSSLTLAPGNELALEEEITLFATLVDGNGDAAASGDQVDGSVEKPISDRSVTFFYDLDGNGSPSLDERLGTAQTASNGVAAFTFKADPTYVVAGSFETGLHAQFGGDDHYSIAGASARLLVTPGAADPSRTLLSAEPLELPSDSSSTTVITAILVDAFANPLSVDSPVVDVTFATTQGKLGDVEYDPVTGHYLTKLQAPAQTGTAVVTVSVDGEEGASVDVTFLPFGCDCDAGGNSTAPSLLLFCLLLLGLFRRQRA